jgi:signal transduction histidine kinase
MLLTLDVRTLYLVCAALFTGMGLASLLMWWHARPLPGMGRLAGAYGFGVAGTALIALRGVVPDGVSVLGGNLLMVMGGGVGYEGIRAFFGVRPRSTLALACVVLVLLTLPYYFYREPSVGARIVIVSGVLAALFAAAGFTAHRRGRASGDGRPAQLTALSFAGLGAILAARAALTLAGPAPNDLFTDAQITTGALLVALVCSGGWTLGLIMTSNHRLTRSAEDARELLASLVAVARATAAGQDLEDTLHRTLDIAGTLTAASGASLHLVDASGTVTREFHARGAASTLESAPAGPHLVSEGLVSWVTRRRASALVPDTRHDERWTRATTGDGPARSALAVPIVSAGGLEGVLTLEHGAPGHFTAEHLRLMEAATAQMAPALRNARISDARLRLARRQTLLYETLRAASGRRAPAEVAAAAVEVAGRHGHRVRIATAASLDDGIGARAGSSPAGTGATQAQAGPDTGTARAPRGELTVPLLSGARELGVMSFAPDAMQPEDARLAESLAEAVALALEHARLYGETSAQRARLAAVLESSRDGLLLLGQAGHVLLLNPAGARHLGLAGQATDWIGRLVAEMATALAPDAAETATVLRALADGAHQGVLGGTWTPGASVIEWLALPVPAVGRLLVLRDVTQVRQAERLREALVHLMVHDLRSPLGSVLAALDMLAEALGPSAKDAELVQLARVSAQRQLALIDAILDVSRIEQGEVPLARRRVALTELVTEVVRLSAPNAAVKGVELRAEAPQDVPEVSIDRDLIARVLENLVANAIRFSPAGGDVRVRVEPHGHAGVRVSVSDGGPGVSPDVLPRLFEKFAAGSHRGHGSGLGLAFCRLAVEAHGGRIVLEERAVSGLTTFTFTLPAAPAQDG